MDGILIQPPATVPLRACSQATINDEKNKQIHPNQDNVMQHKPGMLLQFSVPLSLRLPVQMHSARRKSMQSKKKYIGILYFERQEKHQANFNLFLFFSLNPVQV